MFACVCLYEYVRVCVCASATYVFVNVVACTSECVCTCAAVCVGARDSTVCTYVCAYVLKEINLKRILHYHSFREHR